MGLTLVMCYMAFNTRNMSSDFSEARFIFYSSHELLFCALIIVPLTHTNLTPTYKYVLQSTGLLLVTLVCISLTLGTKIRLALMGTTATREEARRSGEMARASEMARSTSEESSSEVDIQAVA